MYLDLTSLYNRQQKRSNPLFIKIILIYNKCHTFNLYKMHLTLHAIYIHKTYLIKSVCQMYLHLAIFRHRGQFLSSDSREAETAKIRKLDRTLNIIDLIYKPEHFLSLSLSLYAVAYFSFTAARFQPDTLLPVGDYPSPAATTTSFTEDPDEEGSLK